MKGKSRKGVFTLDMTGRWIAENPLSVRELLSDGFEQDVRGCLANIASSLRTGIQLCEAENVFLAEALESIAAGENPVSAFRLKSRKNARFKSLIQLRNFEYQLLNLQAQGASRAQALSIIANANLSVDRPVDPTGEEVQAEIKRLERAISLSRVKK